MERMRLQDFFREFETEFNELLWGNGGQTPGTSAKMPEPAPLKDQLDELDRRRTMVQDFQNRVAEKAQRIADLAKRVRIFINLRDDVNAWRLAMTLDNLRQVLTQEQNELQECRQALERQQRRVQFFRRQSA